MRVIFSGGGTIGPVSPLLAIFEELKQRQPDAEFLWLATRKGPEVSFVKSYDIPVREIFSGKLRRYFSVKNFFDPVLIFFGFVQAFFIILKFKPNVVLSAGGFVSVPVAWAAWLLRRPVIIHQQDVEPGLANKLMSRPAKIITTTFSQSANFFPKKKTTVIGNPVRSSVTLGSREAGLKFLGFQEDKPIVLVMGGGTGAYELNNVVLDSLEQLLSFCQVVHLTGGKVDESAEARGYKSFDFITHEMAHVYAAADLVVCRAGLGTLTEISALKKSAIIVPIPGTHQEANANEFLKANAAAVISQSNLTPEGFAESVRALLNDVDERAMYERNVGSVIDTTAAAKVVDMIV